MKETEPSYLDLFSSSILKERVSLFEEIIKKCTLCPKSCGINRFESKEGDCRSGYLPIVSSCGPHFGEEPPLVGYRGSGTIFFTNCNLSCIFCQNYDISHLGYGKEISFEELAGMMIHLQQIGCHNINFVTPSHMVYAILKALLIAVPRGLRIPLVYNSGGYDALKTIELLDGIFDIYMPDYKYAEENVGRELSGARRYPIVAKTAIGEMYRQVGDLTLDNRGVAYRGLLVRHLVLPHNLAGTDEVIDFIAGLSKNTYLNLMDQYRPCYRAKEKPELVRRITLKEYDEMVALARRRGLKRV
ncbi:MAG: radical SAM protein [Spirochaetes bacterium]|nr:MAG: radical SAM protein [Spirochaetota bacterium]